MAIEDTPLRKLLLILFVLSFSAQGSTPDVKIYHVTDTRDNQRYVAVEIDSVVWMAENLNYKPGGILGGRSWCYDNNNSNCERYGRLYDWKAAMNACPGGWHLPTNKEWNHLINTVGSTTAGKKLKSKILWSNPSGNGTDEFGFSALPSGYRFSDASNDVGSNAYWWTASDCDKDRAYYKYMGSNFENVLPDNQATDDCRGKTQFGYSVRCVKDY